MKTATVLLASAAALTAFALLTTPALAQSAAVAWSNPTPRDHSRIAASLGKSISLELSAKAPAAHALVVIEPVGGLPAGVVLAARTLGATTHTTLEWTPTGPGLYTLRFRATSDGAAPSSTLTFTVDVREAVDYPRAFTLTDRKIGHWAMVARRVAVQATPSRTSQVVATLDTRAPDGTQNLLLVLSGLDRTASETWYRVRLPILPNNSTGWVPASALGKLATVHTHLYIDRARLTAKLERDGRPVFTARIGVGRPYWPTPRGEFYVRSKLTSFRDPFYGPIAFGTSARTAVLTDWPGGGFIGVHGTNLPQLLPGRVSHGCVRMRNVDITRLARLMTVGTPLTIS